MAQIATYIVGLNGAEGEVLCRNGHFTQSVEQCAFANVWQADDAHLHDTHNAWSRLQRKTRSHKRTCFFRAGGCKISKR